MIDQTSLVVGIFKLLSKHGPKDLNVRQMNAVVDAANRILDQLNKPTVLSSPGMGLRAWLASDDTGQSSLAMARHLSHASTPMLCGRPIPQDPDDFGRCYRFLRAVPMGAERWGEVTEMASCSPEWAGMAVNWDELERLYMEELPTGKCGKLYTRMQEIINQAQKEIIS